MPTQAPSPFEIDYQPWYDPNNWEYIDDEELEDLYPPASYDDEDEDETI